VNRSPVGPYPIIADVSALHAANYTLRGENGVLRVRPAPLIIAARSRLVAYGHHLPTLTWQAGFLAGDSVTSLSKLPRCTSTARLDHRGNVSSPAATYAINCSRAAAHNYTIGYRPAKLRVTLQSPALSYAGKSLAVHNRQAHLAAYLHPRVPEPINGRVLVLTIGSGSLEQKCRTKPTDSHGYAGCWVKHVGQTRGQIRITLYFAGDPPGSHHDYASAKRTAWIPVHP
jgi:hypothetical protein